ncbi:unnamed protein product [Medioppia subpectinata]|uniref:5' nucleotidase n=1 Tax=Medioppia subpectinata TaxID=1979941 RepID=A0A7R9KNV0_9ACAR|nr:unnamed protein product [Medioppia subpectinata]CAG2107041.1 unnamed protein product [Medioppia subpectinata]
MKIVKLFNISLASVYTHWLIWLRLAVICRTLNITILHNNDFHTHFEPMNEWSAECKSGEQQCFGGIARTVAKVNEMLLQPEAGNGDNVLFLNAGDHFQGTIWYTLLKWEVVAKFAKFLRHDVMALGNHEFDDGVEGLLPFVRNVTQNNEKNLPIVCANIETSGELRQLIKPSIVVERGGKKIAIIGYITPDTSFLARPGDTVKFNDEIDSIRKEIENLKKIYPKNELNIFIAVGHSGHKKDKEIAEKIPELDVVVGGHSNTFLYTGKPPSIEVPEGPYPVVYDHNSEGKTLVVQAFAYGKYLGKLDVVFDDNGLITSYSGTPILLDSNTKENPKVLAEVQEMAKEIDDHYKQNIGYSYVVLDASGCLMKECNCGNLMADAFVTHFLSTQTVQQKGWNAVPMTVVNGGAVRTTINSGNITIKSVMSTAPFGNPLGVLRTTGYSLWQILKHSASQYKLGGFLQVSGIRYEFDSRLPKGNRLKKVRVRCGDCQSPAYEDLDLSKTYSIAISEYLVNGGDNYTMINKTQFTPQKHLDYDVIIDYVKKYSPIITGLEDRIIDQAMTTTPNSHAISACLAYNLIIVILSVYIYSSYLCKG